jgi:hypothetical protein
MKITAQIFNRMRPDTRAKGYNPYDTCGKYGPKFEKNLARQLARLDFKREFDANRHLQAARP